MVLISVITVNRNNAAGLEKTIKSVTSQSFPDFEFLVVDGDSDDASKEIIKKNENKISYWVSEPDSGIYQAMNKGVDAATGKFLLFLNSGDTLVDGQILSQIAKSLDDTDILSGDMITCDLNGNKKTELSPDVPNAKHFMVSTLWHPTTFIQRKLFLQLGNYNESLKIVSDYDFFMRALIQHQFTYKHIKLPVTIFELDGTSNDPRKFHLMLEERRQVQKAIFTASQLDETEAIEIQVLGRKSNVFQYVPNSKLLENWYDRFYYYWYRRKKT